MNSTKFESIFALNKNQIILFSGVIFFFMAIPLIPLYYLIMRTINSKDGQSPNVTLKLMNLINLIQFSQGMVHFVTAPALVFPRMQSEFNVILRILGCIMNSFWIGALPVMALLSVTRIFIFCNKICPKTIHSSIKFVLFCIISWITFLILAGCITLNMKMTPPMWSYDFEVPYALLFDTLEICLSFPCLLISYMSYLTICWLIYGKQNFKNSQKSRKNELSILLQCTFVMAYTSFLVFIWHPVLIPIVSFIDMTKLRNQAIINGMWIFNCYVNPIMMLIFHKSIREDVCQILKWDVQCGSNKNQQT